MNWLLQPSLGRRVCVTLIVAFLMTTGVVLLSEYTKFRVQVENASGLRVFGRALAAQIETLDDDDEKTRAFVSQMAAVLNRVRRDNDLPLERMTLQLFRANGGPVFLSDGAPATLLQGESDKVLHLRLNDKPYSVYAKDTPKWSLRVAEPRLPDRVVVLLLINSIWPDTLLAFPFILIPVLLAVYQGLKPLRKLSAQMAARDSDDLSPIGLDLKYGELRPLVAAFDGLLAKLRYKVQRERAFVQDAAHELRTPMAVIAAQAHVLTKAETVEARQIARQALDDAIARTSHLTRQLLELATLDRALEGGREYIDVAQLLQQMLGGLTPTALSRGIELSLDAPDSLKCVVDVGALRTVVENLLDNALRYVPSGGMVAVSLERGAEGLRLCVADDGPGIDAADRPYVFDRFYRGRGHDLPGTGLGLAIVWKAVQAMRGGIRLDAGLGGKGVAFVLSIPD